jgi:hypothetical protein
MEVRDNVARIQERMAQALARSGRTPGSVTLIAVTKRVELARIRAAATAGVYDFGENYVQEANEKIPHLLQIGGLPDVSHETFRPVFHLIGQLQSNKAKIATGLFDIVQTVDRISLAKELNRHAHQQNKVLPVLLEVNLSGQEGRGGVLPEKTFDFFQQVAGFANVSVQGLMGMAPFGNNPEEARSYFKQLYGLWDKLPPANRQTLSMGMSGDFEVAIEEGATHIRVGTALFGQRS